jgi:hypothetical protein
MAAYVAILAKNTGWSEHYILWELPLIRGNAYCHAFMRMNRVNTEPAEEKALLIKQIDEL